jgi:hypothetical protein
MQAGAALPPTARPGLFGFHFSFNYFANDPWDFLTKLTNSARHC